LLYENHVKAFFKLTTTCDISFEPDFYMHFFTYITSISRCTFPTSIIIIIIFTIIIVIIIIIILGLQYLIQIQIICLFVYMYLNFYMKNHVKVFFKLTTTCDIISTRTFSHVSLRSLHALFHVSDFNHYYHYYFHYYYYYIMLTIFNSNSNNMFFVYM